MKLDFPAPLGPIRIFIGLSFSLSTDERLLKPFTVIVSSSGMKQCLVPCHIGWTVAYSTDCDGAVMSENHTNHLRTQALGRIIWCKTSNLHALALGLMRSAPQIVAVKQLKLR